MNLLRSSFVLAALLAGSVPAFAHGEGGGHGHGGAHGGWAATAPGWNGGWVYPVMPYQGVYTVTAPTVAVPQNAPPASPAYPYAYPSMPQPDAHWQDMMERCSRPPRTDNGVGGAVIGGVVGGVIGNRVADGDRLLGTVAGAAVGAAAGAVIDKAEDKDHERALRDECDAWFSQNSPQGYPGGAYGYPGYIMVPVMLPAQQKPCVETTTVTEEFVSVPTRARSAPRRPAPRHKRVKEKRVYTGS